MSFFLAAFAFYKNDHCLDSSEFLVEKGGKVRAGTGTFEVFRRNVAAYEGSKKATPVRRDFREILMEI